MAAPEYRCCDAKEHPTGRPLPATVEFFEPSKDPGGLSPFCRNCVRAASRDFEDQKEAETNKKAHRHIRKQLRKGRDLPNHKRVLSEILAQKPLEDVVKNYWIQVEEAPDGSPQKINGYRLPMEMIVRNDEMNPDGIDPAAMSEAELEEHFKEQQAALVREVRKEIRAEQEQQKQIAGPGEVVEVGPSQGQEEDHC